jgi:molecular chaperone Hsp33
VLPFCSDETLDVLEANLGTLPSMTQLLNAGLSPQGIVERILAGLGSSSTADAIVPQ